MKKRPAAVPHVDPHEEYRRLLVKERSALLSGLGQKIETRAGMGRVAEDDQGPLSHEEFVSMHLNTLDHTRLRRVNEALDRLNSGHYGVCLACDEPISVKRLRAVPWAVYCIRCQDTAVGEDEKEGQAARPALVG